MAVSLDAVNTLEELRAALAHLSPGRLATFDAERAAALAEARQQVTSVPLRRFTMQWAVYVALERYPERAARLRELEAAANETTDLAQGRAIASEVGRILDAAYIDAGAMCAAFIAVPGSLARPRTPYKL